MFHFYSDDRAPLAFLIGELMEQYLSSEQHFARVTPEHELLEAMNDEFQDDKEALVNALYSHANLSTKNTVCCSIIFVLSWLRILNSDISSSNLLSIGHPGALVCHSKVLLVVLQRHESGEIPLFVPTLEWIRRRATTGQVDDGAFAFVVAR